MTRCISALTILAVMGATDGLSLAAPPGRNWSPTEELHLRDHLHFYLSSIQADTTGTLEMIGEGYGISDNAFYSLMWSDSSWAVRWRLDHHSGLIVRAVAPPGRVIFVWKSHAPTIPEGYTTLLVSEVTDGTPGPADTLALVQLPGSLFSAAASTRRRWVAWMDRMRTDYSRAELKTSYSDFGQAWREGPTVAGNASYGMAAAAVDDTTLLLVWGEMLMGLRWGTATGTGWTEGSPPVPSHWYAFFPRLSPRKAGGYWLGWLQMQEESPHNDYAVISRFVGGSWSQPESVWCHYPTAGQWISDAFDVSYDPAEFPSLAWNICSPGGEGQDHSCISCPTDSGPLVADAISSTSTDSSPLAAIDRNGDVWLAWKIFTNTTYWGHTYTRAMSTVPTVDESGNGRLVSWRLSEAAPGSWWTVQRAREAEPFEEVARLQAGPGLGMSWSDPSPPASTLRYRIRRESLDARYRWLSPDTVWTPSTGRPLQVVLTSSNPTGRRVGFDVLNASRGVLDVRIYDVSGRLVLRRRPMAAGGGRDRLDLDLGAASSATAPGLRLLRATDASGKRSSVVKLVFLK